MNIVQLKNFITIADLGSMAKAAEYLYVAQSTLSRQIASLEEEMGTVLFVRGMTTLTLTEAGRLVLEEARKTVDRWDRLSKNFAETKNQIKGTLRIGFQGNYLNDELRQAIKEFGNKYPGIDIKLIRKEFRGLVKAIESEGADGIIVTEAATNGLSDVEAWTVDTDNETLCCVPADSELAHKKEITPEDIVGHKFFLVNDAASITDTTVQHLNKIGVIADFEFVSNVDTMMILVGAGKGISIVGSSIFIGPYENVSFIPSCIWERSAKIQFVYKKANKNPALPLFGEVLQRVAQGCDKN